MNSVNSIEDRASSWSKPQNIVLKGMLFKAVACVFECGVDIWYLYIILC